MDQPRYTDLCAFIRRDIEITQKLIDDDRVGLQHPERLTHDDVVRLEGDIERRGELLDSFQDAFRRCRAEKGQHGPLAVAVARPTVVRFNSTSEIAVRTGQWKTGGAIMSQDDDQLVSLADLAQIVDSPMIRVMGSERVDGGTHAALGAVVAYLDELGLPV